MGVIRGFLISIFVSILLISLLFMNIFLTISYSLEYDKLKPSIESLTTDFLEKNEKISYIENNLEKIRNYCKPHSEIIYNLNQKKYNISCENISQGPEPLLETLKIQNSFSQIEIELLKEDINSNYEYYLDYCEPKSEYILNNLQQNFDSNSLAINCNVVEKDVEEIIKETISDYFDKIYYNKYECDFSVKNLFFDCFLKYKSPFFLISEQAKMYWEDKFFSLLIINILIGIIIFLFLEKKSNWFLVIGILLVLSSIPFISSDWLMFFLDNKYLEIYSALFTQYYQTFLISFLLGLSLIGIGFIFKFFKLGFYISKRINSLNNKFKKKSDTTEKTNKEDNNLNKKEIKKEK